MKKIKLTDDKTEKGSANMPEKSVRSMGRLERRHRSISAKTF